MGVYTGVQKQLRQTYESYSKQDANLAARRKTRLDSLCGENVYI